MGTFIGHILPGSFFLLFGIWWTVKISRLRIRLSKVNKERESENRLKPPSHHVQTAFLSFCLGRYVPVESILKVIFTFIGMCAEYGLFFKKSIGAGEWQHVVMYAMFLFNGLTELMVHYEILIPRGAAYFTGILAFLLEAMLFVAHSEHDDNPEKQVHMILIVTILLTCLCIMIEAWIPENLGFKYIRAFFVILQGTWFFQVAFLIYNPIPGRPKVWHARYAHEENMWLYIMYSLHCMAVLMFQLAVMFLIWLCNSYGCQSNSTKTHYKTLDNSDLLLLNQNDHTVNGDIDDDDDGSSFQPV